jgi:hypothetical protein
MRSRLLGPSQDDYRWVFDVLWASPPSAAWAPAGELPAGYELAEQFAVLPAGAGRSFTVSLATRRGTAAALTAYNALRPPRRQVARGVLGLGVRAGLVQPLLGTRIDVGTAPGSRTGQPGHVLLSEHLSSLFETSPVVIAFGGGSGPYRKPVLQVFSATGSPLGYVKVGWNEWTRKAVLREAAALRACALRPMHLGAPALLDQCTWNGLELLVTAPLPRGVRRLPRDAQMPEVALLREITALSRLSRSDLGSSPWWVGLRQRIETGVETGARSSLTRIVDDIESSYGTTALDFGTWHGDLVPWNLARHDSRLYAWDWECSAPAAPVGFDPIHFHFQVAFVADGLPVEDAVTLAARKAAPTLEALGVPSEAHRLLSSLHLLELFVRHEEARSSAGGVDDRFYPAVEGALGRALGAGSVRCGKDSA